MRRARAENLHDDEFTVEATLSAKPIRQGRSLVGILLYKALLTYTTYHSADSRESTRRGDHRGGTGQGRQRPEERQGPAVPASAAAGGRVGGGLQGR